MRFFLGFLAIFAALGSASANLGDSEAKINAAYGKRLEMRRDSDHFRVASITVSVGRPPNRK